MRNNYKIMSLLISLLMLVCTGCGRNVSNSGDEISVSLSTENNDPDEKYKDYLQERIAEVIVQSTGCSSVNSDIEMTEDGTIAKVKISSGEYAFSEEEKETIIQYIENLAGNPNVEVAFINEAIEVSEDNYSFNLNGYTGYLDELDAYRDEFYGRDYDGDGKTDRLYRISDTGFEMSEYRIDFGNGSKLYDKDVSESAFPHVYSVDLDKDGVNEIVMTYTVRPADREEFTWFTLFDREYGPNFSKVDSLLQSTGGMECITVKIKKIDLRTASYTVLETGFSREVQIDGYYDQYDDDLMEDCWEFWESNDYTIFVHVCMVEVENEDNPCLHCYANVLPDTSNYIKFDIVYEDDEYRIINMTDEDVNPY